MDQANIAPVTFTGYEGHRHAQPLYETYTPHCILVNRNAERFVSEGSASLGSALDERGPDGKPKHLPVWRIFDSRYKHTLGMHYASKDPAFVRSAPNARGVGGEDRPRSGEAAGDRRALQRLVEGGRRSRLPSRRDGVGALLHRHSRARARHGRAGAVLRRALPLCQPRHQGRARAPMRAARYCGRTGA